MPKIQVSEETTRWCVVIQPGKTALLFPARGVTIQEGSSPLFFVYISESGALVGLEAHQHFARQEDARAFLTNKLQQESIRLAEESIRLIAAAADLARRPLLPDNAPAGDLSMVDPALRPN